MDGLGSEWTGQGVKLDGPNDLEWTVLGKSRRSSGMKVHGPKRSNGLSILLTKCVGGKLGMSVTSKGEIRARMT